MKNITVLTALVIIIFSFAVKNSVYGQETDNYGFSAALQSGFVRGQATELVYPVPGHTMGELLSELKWDMKPVYYLGMQLDYNRTNLMSRPGFFSSLSFKAGIPSDSGIMENRDWMSIENDALTHFSTHTNKTRQFFWLDAAAGISLPVKSLFYVKPFLSGSWMRFAFTGRNGYGIYARGKTYDIFNNPLTFYPIDDNPREESFEGIEVIRYRQNWFIIAAGISAGTRIFPSLSIDLSFQISPFTWCYAIDEHIIGNTQYKDISSMSLFLESSASLSYSLRLIDLLLEFTWRHIVETKGDSYISQYGSPFSLLPGKAGAGLSLMDIRFLVKIRF